ncbi:MAG: hypothetical protein KGL39_60410 [Patescibacteria group bacterium]|nr:hypothetical protein [Patescibacteria group bacterium]
MSLERETVLQVLSDSRSQREAARRLGIPKSTFHDCLKCGSQDLRLHDAPRSTRFI